MTPHTQHSIRVSAGIQIAVQTWGHRPGDGPPREVAVMLHGFPDRADLWAGVAAHLAPHCQVVAFDMRGCGQSTPLTGTRHYHYSHLIDDLFDVIDHVSPGQKVHLVGHDWGGLYGWDALLDPRAHARVASFVTLAPSLQQVAHWMRHRVQRPTPTNLLALLHQVLVSNSLMGLFTMPGLPHLLWRSGLGLKVFGQLVQRLEGVALPASPGVEADAVRSLGIYRANLLQQLLRPRPVDVTPIPVHTLIATRDPFLPPRVFEGCSAWTQHPSQSLLDASHWAPLSRPAEIAAKVLDMTRRWPAAHNVTRPSHSA